jgi:hypothetical protein
MTKKRIVIIINATNKDIPVYINIFLILTSDSISHTPSIIVIEAIKKNEDTTAVVNSSLPLFRSSIYNLHDGLTGVIVVVFILLYAI